MARVGGCCAGRRPPGTILYRLLNGADPDPDDGPGGRAGARARARAVLLKTQRFVQGVPCFLALPPADRLVLLRAAWTPLLALGLAQDGVVPGGLQAPRSSVLRSILTRRPPPAAPRHLRAVEAFLAHCWTLGVTSREYAYLKGTVLFNPDLPGLRSVRYVRGLHLEARRALDEQVRSVHRGDHARVAQLNAALGLLTAIPAHAVAELFFRPVVRAVAVDDVLLETVCAKREGRGPPPRGGPSPAGSADLEDELAHL